MTQPRSQILYVDKQIAGVMEQLRASGWDEIRGTVYDWLIQDQIPESGGWGKSQQLVVELLSGRKPSTLERQEGGIISTFMALRGLKHFEDSPLRFRRRSYAKQALEYLLQRQNRMGAFGRYVESRSGREIHPSARHTALAVSSLIDLKADPRRVVGGMTYLHQLSKSALLDDASPSLAIGLLIYATEKFMRSPEYCECLSQQEKARLKLDDWASERTVLLRELVSLSMESSQSPFWPPYGGYASDLMYTAVATLDFLSDFVAPFIKTTIIDVISTIQGYAVCHGIPYFLDSANADIGMTAHFLSVILRPKLLFALENFTFVKHLLDFATELANFLVVNFENERFRKVTDCDTLSNALLISQPIFAPTAEKQTDIYTMEETQSEIAAKYRENLRIVEDQIADFVDPRSVPPDLKVAHSRLLNELEKLGNTSDSEEAQ